MIPMSLAPPLSCGAKYMNQNKRWKRQPQCSLAKTNLVPHFVQDRRAPFAMHAKKQNKEGEIR